MDSTKHYSIGSMCRVAWGGARSPFQSTPSWAACLQPDSGYSPYTAEMVASSPVGAHLTNVWAYVTDIHILYKGMPGFVTDLADSASPKDTRKDFAVIIFQTEMLQCNQPFLWGLQHLYINFTYAHLFTRNCTHKVEPGNKFQVPPMLFESYYTGCRHFA